MIRPDLPLSALITGRMRELGLSRTELAARCHFTNITKGIRRLDQVLEGDLSRAQWLLRGLPAALELPPAAVQQAAEATLRQQAEEEEARWRAAFRPAAYLIGTQRFPSPIFIFAMTGGAERHLKIPLDLRQPPSTYADQAHAVVRRTPTVAYFGPTTGFHVNFSPDNAVRFDLAGRALWALDGAYIPGEATMRIGGRDVRPRTLARIFGTAG